VSRVRGECGDGGRRLLAAALAQSKDRGNVHWRRVGGEVDNDNLDVGDERDDHHRDHHPAGRIEYQQSSETSQQSQSVEFCEVRVRRRIFPESSEAHRDGRQLGQYENGDRPECPADCRLAQNPEDDQHEKIVDRVGDAIEAAQRLRCDSETPRKNSVQNVRESAHEQNRQVNDARRAGECAGQCQRAEEQPERREEKWKMALQIGAQPCRLRYADSSG